MGHFDRTRHKEFNNTIDLIRHLDSAVCLSKVLLYIGIAVELRLVLQFMLKNELYFFPVLRDECPFIYASCAGII